MLPFIQMNIYKIPRLLDQARQKRTDHLIDVFGVSNQDGKKTARNEMGLPGVTKVRVQICEIGRGNIYSAMMERDIRAVLPSLIEVLRVGLKMEGKEGLGGDVSLYEYDLGSRRRLDGKSNY